MQAITELLKYKKGVRPYKLFSTATTTFVLAITGVLTITGIAPALVSYLIAINAAAVILCFYDKGVSDTDYIRVPEKILLLVAFVGGSAGVLFGMKTFRHKTKKASFQLMLAVLIAAQAYLLSTNPDLLTLEPEKLLKLF